MYFFSSSSSSSPSTLKIGDPRMFRWLLKLSGRVLLFSSRLGKCISSLRSISIFSKWDSHSSVSVFLWTESWLRKNRSSFSGSSTKLGLVPMEIPIVNRLEIVSSRYLHRPLPYWLSPWLLFFNSRLLWDPRRPGLCSTVNWRMNLSLPSLTEMIPLRVIAVGWILALHSFTMLRISSPGSLLLLRMLWCSLFLWVKDHNLIFFFL